MPGKREEKRDDLRERLVAAATARIARSGLAGLRARDVTSDAGCALGALYTAFEDLDGLIYAVTARTLAALEHALREAVAAESASGRQLQRLGATYLGFARSQPHLWRALFEHRVAGDAPAPEWHAARQTALLQLIAGPLGRLQPDLDETELMVRSRTLFAAVHGIVSISLENRFIGIPTTTLDAELDRFVGLVVTGLKIGRAHV